MACLACGRQNLPGASVCEACGASLIAAAPGSELVIELADAPPPVAALAPVGPAQVAASVTSAGRVGGYLTGLLVVTVLALGGWWWRGQAVAPASQPVPATVVPAAEVRPVPAGVVRPSPQEMPLANGRQAQTAPAPAPAPAPPPAMPVDTRSEPVAIPKAEGKPSLAQMQTAAKALRPQPESCDEGVRWLEGQYGLPAKQAQKLASRVFVTQCAAAPTERYAPAPPSAAVAAPAEASLPPPVVSIDEQYNRRVAAECARGLFGVVCRDRIKNELCKGRFSNQPPPGETRCKQGLQQDSRDH